MTVSDGWHRRRWVTSKVSDTFFVNDCLNESNHLIQAGEELEQTLTVDKVRKRHSLMFWACFAGPVKGPHLFWEKDWGSIDSQRYFEKVMPLISSWMSENPGFFFMQDGAPSHSSHRTTAELDQIGIFPMTWPAYSPDLNPIENVRNLMKDFIKHKYPDLPDGKERSYDQLRMIVKEAQGLIKSDELSELVASMQRRCQAVIDADGRHTKY